MVFVSSFPLATRRLLLLRVLMALTDNSTSPNNPSLAACASPIPTSTWVVLHVLIPRKFPFSFFSSFIHITTSRPVLIIVLLGFNTHKKKLKKIVSFYTKNRLPKGRDLTCKQGDDGDGFFLPPLTIVERKKVRTAGELEGPIILPLFFTRPNELERDDGHYKLGIFRAKGQQQQWTCGGGAQSENKRTDTALFT